MKRGCADVFPVPVILALSYTGIWYEYRHHAASCHIPSCQNSILNTTFPHASFLRSIVFHRPFFSHLQRCVRIKWNFSLSFYIEPKYSTIWFFPFQSSTRLMLWLLELWLVNGFWWVSTVLTMSADQLYPPLDRWNRENKTGSDFADLSSLVLLPAHCRISLQPRAGPRKRFPILRSAHAGPMQRPLWDVSRRFSSLFSDPGSLLFALCSRRSLEEFGSTGRHSHRRLPTRLRSCGRWTSCNWRPLWLASDTKPSRYDFLVFLLNPFLLHFNTERYLCWSLNSRYKPQYNALRYLVLHRPWH